MYTQFYFEQSSLALVRSLNVKTVLFKTIQFGINAQFKCIKTVNANHRLVLFNPKIGPLSGATTLGQRGPWSDGNKGVPRIPQRSSFAGTSPSDCLVL